MKKIFFAFLFFISIFFSLNVFAAQDVQNYNINENETRNGIVFWGGKTFENLGTVNNDMYIAGQTLKNSAVVNGDIFAAGQNILINGAVNGNVRLAGETIDINGKVDRNVLMFGNQVSVDETGLVNGTMSVFANIINIKGTVNKGLHISGSKVVIDGLISGDVYLDAENITIKPTAKINGNLSYNSNAITNIANEAITGNIKETTTNRNIEKEVHEQSHKNFLFLALKKIMWVISSFILGALLILLFSDFYKKASYSTKESWGKYLGIGFLAFVSVPTAIILLLITFIGIPLSIVILILYILLLYLAKIPVSICIGNWLFKNQNIYLKLFIGLLIIAILKLIPYIGFLTSLVVIWIGLGSYVYNIFFNKKRVDLVE